MRKVMWESNQSAFQLSLLFLLAITQVEVFGQQKPADQVSSDFQGAGIRSGKNERATQTVKEDAIEHLFGKYDTVYVSSDMTTYLIFPEAIQLLDIGSRSYVGKIESGNMLFLKPTSARVTPSSLLVRTESGTIYLNYIAYKQKPLQIFFDYRQSYPGLAPIASGRRLEKEIRNEFDEKLDYLKKRPKRQLLSVSANYVSLTVSNLAVDEQAIYLLLDVENKSSIPYKIEYVSFTYKEKRARKARRKIEPEANVVKPLAIQAATTVHPRRIASLGYALPLFAGTKSGFLEVMLREENGNRVLKAEIPASRLSKATYLTTPITPSLHVSIPLR